MSKVSVDRELLNSALKTIHGLAPGRFTVEEELRAAVTAQPAEAEGVVDTGSDAWMALHLLDRLSVDSSDELRVMQIEGIVKSMGAALSAVTAERDRLQAALDDPDYPPKHSRRLIAQLRAEVDGLRKDAERYQWLRSVGGRSYSDTKTGEKATGEIYDSCIDAAMAAKEA